MCAEHALSARLEHRAEQEKSLSPASVQDVIAWYDRMIASGNAALVWIVLRNFGFDGRLRKKRIKQRIIYE